MTTDFIESLEPLQGQPLTRQLLLSLLKDYKRPWDKISDLVRQEKLTQVRRGIFVPGDRARVRGPEPFLLANHLLGPSYVSLESALSYWQLIPEQVFEVTSVTTARSKSYQTKVGRFSYWHLPLPYYAFGQQRVELAPGQYALIARPEKAVCDKIIATSALNFRSLDQVRSWLIEDMRMDPDQLRKMNSGSIAGWLKDAPKQRSLELLIKALPDL